MNKFTRASKKRLRKGTSKGGKIAAANLTREERRQRALNAVQARERKRQSR